MTYGEGGNVAWLLTLGGGRILFEMEYRSQPFLTDAAPQDFECPSEHGRGILLMRALTDHVEYKFSRGKVHLSLMKKLTIG
jgi:anti-sigma regulatory factor (Ser/Thr protein kinase)